MAGLRILAVRNAVNTCHELEIFYSLYLGGGFKYFLFSPLPGEDFQFDYIIFLKGVETTNQLHLFCR